MEREGFVFYRSFAQAISCLEDEQKLRVFDAIIEYGLNGNEIELSGAEKGIFILIKPQIDANNKRYENGCKGAEFGKLGGRPKKEKENPEKTPKKPQENPTKTRKDKDKEKDKEKDKVKDKELILSSPSGLACKKIIDYLNERTGSHYKYTTEETIRHIQERMNEGYSIADFKNVIDKKAKDWMGTDYEQYLRPSTLFKPSNFENYVNQKPPSKVSKSFAQGSSRYEDIEKLLLEN